MRRRAGYPPNEGVDAYAVHGESALVCAGYGPPALAAAVARLLG